MFGQPTSPPLLFDRESLRKQRIKEIAVAVAFLAVSVMSMGMGIWTIQSKLDERHLWTTGTPALNVDFEGKVTETKKFGIPLYKTYDLQVRYVDQQQQEHSGDVHFDVFWTQVPVDREATVRYDPAAPSNFAISLSAEAGLGGWGFAILGPFVALLMLGVAVSSLRAARAYAQIAAALTSPA